MERAIRWLAIWHVSAVVSIHVLWLLVWYRTGAVPSPHDSWRLPPLSTYPAAHGGSIGALLATLYGGPFTAAFAIVHAARVRTGEMSACAAVIVCALLVLWLDPAGAINWYAD
jgi:hypothetical protein